jgi:hypothetical protein
MNINDLPYLSVTQMTDDQLLSHILETRKNRKIQPERKKKKEAAAKSRKKKTALPDLKNLDPEMAAALIALLEAEIGEEEGQ